MHRITVNMHADQFITVNGKGYNIHDIKGIVVNHNGVIQDVIVNESDKKCLMDTPIDKINCDVHGNAENCIVDKNDTVISTLEKFRSLICRECPTHGKRYLNYHHTEKRWHCMYRNCNWKSEIC